MSSDITLTSIGKGKYSDIFKVQKDDTVFVMKISYYREETVRNFAKKMSAGDIEGARREKETDAISISEHFSKIARSMLKHRLTPHFMTVYESRDMKNFIEKIPSMTNRLKELSDLQKKYNHVFFMDLYEMDLTKYFLKKTDDDIVRSIIFQVVYSILAAQKVLKNFRHNDLSTNNVLIKKVPIHVNSYTIEETTFFTHQSFDICIMDYDFVHADINKLRNNRVTSGRFKLSDDRNASYDVHFFLKSVMKCINKNFRSKTLLSRKFLESLELQEDDRCSFEIESLLPENILKNSYFDSLKNKPTVHINNEFSLP